MPAPSPSESVVISGAGLWTPENVLTNVELVQVLNAYADQFNEANKVAIAAGELEPVAKSDPDFIEKASGIPS